MTKDDIENILNSSISRVSIVRKKNGQIVIREIDYVPSLTYLKENPERYPSETSLLGGMKNFTGVLTTKTWQGKPINLNSYWKGTMTNQPLKFSNEKEKSNELGVYTSFTSFEEYERMFGNDDNKRETMTEVTARFPAYYNLPMVTYNPSGNSNNRSTSINLPNDMSGIYDAWHTHNVSSNDEKININIFNIGVITEDTQYILMIEDNIKFQKFASNISEMTIETYEFIYK